MAKLDTIQTSFVGGELAPSLLGRTDIAQYDNACAEVENFLVRPYGSLISTPGTEFISECKTGGTTDIVRLLEFNFSRSDAYVIEMGVGYFRFFTDGAVVVSPGTTPYEVAHTYSATEIPDIQITQLNDVIYITHKDHITRTLTRSAAASWALADFAFTGGPYLDDNTTATTLTPSATSGTIDVTVSPTNASLFTVSGATLGHKNTYWKIGTTITSVTTGLSVQGYVQLTNVVNTYTATASVIKTLNVSIATTDWAEGAWSAVRGWPARVGFHQQRLFFARTDKEPQKVWGSEVFVYTNFSLDGGEDSDALNLQLVSNESNDIKWLASGKVLVAGTYGGDFTINSGTEPILTPANTNVTKQTGWGSEDVIPKKIGNYFYYIQRFSRKLRELFYFWDLDTYKSVDKTILSPHISGDGFKELAYQQNPDTVLWAVRSDGTIATMTREVDQEVQGWSRQVTDGNYESIASIPSQDGPHDEIWVVVNRTIDGSTKRYIERFASPIVPDRQDKCYYLHSALAYDSYATSLSSSASISLSATAGTITLTSSTAYFTTSDVSDRIRAVSGSTNTTVGEIKITGYTSSTVVIGTVTTSFSTTAYAAGNWGLSVSQISGLDHLEAESIGVLADGGTDKPAKTVSNGAITLGYNYFYVLAGMPYTQKIKSLIQEKGSKRGTSQGKKQRINEVGFKVNNSFKGFKTGGETAMLDPINFRDPTTLMGTPEALYTGVIPNISFRDDYRYGSQVLIQNSEPLPIELLNLITSIDTNDK